MNRKIRRSNNIIQYLYYVSQHMKRSFFRKIEAIVSEGLERHVLKNMVYLHLKILLREKRREK